MAGAPKERIRVKQIAPLVPGHCKIWVQRISLMVLNWLLHCLQPLAAPISMIMSVTYSGGGLLATYATLGLKPGTPEMEDTPLREEHPFTSERKDPFWLHQIGLVISLIWL